MTQSLLAARTVGRWMLVRLPLTILAGAVATVGVAWGCALWGLPQGECTTYYLLHRSKETIEVSDFEGPCARVLRWKLTDKDTAAVQQYMADKGLTGFSGRLSPDRLRYAEPAVLPSWAALDEADSQAKIAVPYSPVQYVGVGWPMTSMFWRNAPPVAAARQRTLPTLILPGFAVNTLLAAGVLLVMVECFAFARRRVRCAKGRCAACGYDRGGLAKEAACPECGGKAS